MSHQINFPFLFLWRISEKPFHEMLQFLYIFWTRFLNFVAKLMLIDNVVEDFTPIFDIRLLQDILWPVLHGAWQTFFFHQFFVVPAIETVFKVSSTANISESRPMPTPWKKK